MTRTSSRIPRVMLIAAGCVVVLGMIVGGLWAVRRERIQAGFLHVASRVLTMELRVAQASPTASFQHRYRPFRRWLMPGSQAAKFTQWLLQQDMSLNRGGPPLVQENSHWSARKPPIISRHGDDIAVVLNFFWQRTFLPAGHSQGSATLTVLFQERDRRWQISALAWNSNPASGPIHPNSFAYDFTDLAGSPTLPQSDPPGLRPRVSNP